MRRSSLVVALALLAATSPEAPGQGFGRAGRRVAVGPRGGVAVGGYRGGAAIGPWGGIAAGGVRGGAYIGPRGAAVQAGRVGGVGVGPGHYTRYWSPSYLNTRAAYARGAFVPPVFNAGWYRANPAAWAAARWSVPNVWVAPAWSSVATFCDITAPPVVYDYGGSTVLDNNTLYVNGEQVGTAEQYAAQAADLVSRGRDATPDPNDEWQPLGVFLLVQGDDDLPEHVFQLAVNKSGVVRGNYYDALVNATQRVSGFVDPKTQRVAWSADKNAYAFETGLNNLTLDQTTVLVHYGTSMTTEMALVRLDQPQP